MQKTRKSPKIEILKQSQSLKTLEIFTVDKAYLSILQWEMDWTSLFFSPWDFWLTVVSFTTRTD